jgi:hypothetical protein
MTQVSALEQFQENLLHCILSTAAFTGDCHSQQQKRRAMLAVQEVDLSDVTAGWLHARASTIRQPSRANLSMILKQN